MSAKIYNFELSGGINLYIDGALVETYSPKSKVKIKVNNGILSVIPIPISSISERTEFYIKDAGENSNNTFQINGVTESGGFDVYAKRLTAEVFLDEGGGSGTTPISTDISNATDNTSAAGALAAKQYVDSKKAPSRTITATATLVVGDGLVLCDATSNSIVVTLPDAAARYASVGAAPLTIMRIDTQWATWAVSFVGSANGAAIPNLTSQYSLVSVESDGSLWKIVGNNTELELDAYIKYDGTNVVLTSIYKNTLTTSETFTNPGTGVYELATLSNNLNLSTGALNLIPMYDRTNGDFWGLCRIQQGLNKIILTTTNTSAVYQNFNTSEIYIKIQVKGI